MNYEISTQSAHMKMDFRKLEYNFMRELEKQHDHGNILRFEMKKNTRSFEI